MAQSDPPPQIISGTSTPARVIPRRRRALGIFLALAGIALFGMLLFRIAGPRPVPSPKVVDYTPQQSAAARKDLDALSAQLLAPPPAASPAMEQMPPPNPAGKTSSVSAVSRVPAKAAGLVRLQLSQADLNTYLATDPKVKAMLASRGIQAVQLFLQAPHAVTCRAAVLYKGQKTNVQITGDLLPDHDDFARFIATKAQVGALPLPAKVVTAQANRIAGQFLGRVRGRIPVAVQDIQVVGDHLVLTGIRRPASKG